MSNLSNYANLSEEQTELLKYLNSELLETQTSLNRSISMLAHWIKNKSELSEDDGLHGACDYEINTHKQSITSLRRRFDYLVEQLKWAQTAYEFITSPL
jgi:uncharacterized coiled-coil protein SlyX